MFKNTNLCLICIFITLYFGECVDSLYKKTYIGPSLINGYGAFTKYEISKNSKIGIGINVVYSANVLRSGESRNLSLSVTPELGIWVNHCSINPSAILDTTIDKGGRLWLYALRNLNIGDEITINYNSDSTKGLLVPSEDNFVTC